MDVVAPLRRVVWLLLMSPPLLSSPLSPLFLLPQGQFILDGKFDPAFPLKHAQKDMRFAVVRNNSSVGVVFSNEMKHPPRATPGSKIFRAEGSLLSPIPEGFAHGKWARINAAVKAEVTRRELPINAHSVFLVWFLCMRQLR